ncbi:hypothetical protein T08_13332 [Trichinella sp. T8]|nr:hypothetical protein T08_13332 [Trichinella sp. T8]
MPVQRAPHYYSQFILYKYNSFASSVTFGTENEAIVETFVYDQAATCDKGITNIFAYIIELIKRKTASSSTT